MSFLLIRNAAILSVDPKIGTLPRGDLLVEGDRIAAVGPNLPAPEGAKVIEADGMIALPGFVNAHIHTWQTALRGIAADWTIPQYLRSMHAGLATLFAPADILIANRMGALLQLDAGTTTIGDWFHNNPTPDYTEAALDGLEAAGIRAVFLHGSPKPDPKPGQPHFSEIPMPRGEVERLLKGRLAGKDGLITLGLAVLGPQMSVQAVCDTDFRLAKELGLRTSMHVSGKLLTPGGFAKLNADGLLGPHVNVVHGNGLDDTDLKRLVDAGVNFTPTPEIECQMGYGNPLTCRVRALGANDALSLGSDIESIMAGDMPAVTRFALQSARHENNLAHRARHGEGPADQTIRTDEALDWATMGGARMLGLDHRIGSLTPGKQADIVLLSTGGMTMQPVHDPLGSLIFHASRADIDTVLVAGQVRKQGGRLVAAPSAQDFDALKASGLRIMADFRELMKAHG